MHMYLILKLVFSNDEKVCDDIALLCRKDAVDILQHNKLQESKI